MTAALLFSPQMLTLYGVIALGAIHAIQAIRAAAPSSSTPATPNVPAVHPATPNSPTPTGHPVLDAIKHMLGGATASNADAVLADVASVLTATQGTPASAAPAVDPTIALLAGLLNKQPAPVVAAPAKAA